MTESNWNQETASRDKVSAAVEPYVLGSSGEAGSDAKSPGGI